MQFPCENLSTYQLISGKEDRVQVGSGPMHFERVVPLSGLQIVQRCNFSVISLVLMIEIQPNLVCELILRQ